MTRISSHSRRILTLTLTAALVLLSTAAAEHAAHAAPAIHEQARAQQAEVARLRVKLERTPLRESCSPVAYVKGTLARGDELEVVRKVDVNWYRVRLPGSKGVEGCVAASAVEPIAGPSTSTPPERPGGQTGTPRRPDAARAGTPQPRPFRVSGFVDLGQTFFTASDSFNAILDSSSGGEFGGGALVTLPYNLFARVDVARFRKEGERVFVSNGEVFRLGIPTTITVRPVEFTGGYRREVVFGRGPRRPPQPPRPGRPASKPGRGFRLFPFAGGGVGVVNYQETADFAQPGDAVDESFTSYHALGGVDIPIWRWIGVGVEYQHRWVPDALGTGGVSAEFRETDLGGNIFRVRFIVGF
jgi:hypothetical protein